MDEPPDKKLAKAKTWNTPKKLLVADGTADAEGANAPPPPTRAAGDAAALNTTDSSAGVSVSDATDAAAAGAEKPLPKGVFRRQVKAGMRYGYQFKMGGGSYKSGADYETAEAAAAAIVDRKAQVEREAAERRAADEARRQAAAAPVVAGARRRRPTALAAAPVSMELDAFPNTGSWSDAPQEEVYANIIIDLFFAGELPNVRDGATLTATLATLLLCKPMRVSNRLVETEVKGGQRFKTSGDPSPEAAAALREARKAFLRAKRLPADPSEPATAEVSASAPTDAAATPYCVVTHLHAGNHRSRATAAPAPASDGRYFFDGQMADCCIGGDATRPCMRLRGFWRLERGAESVIAETNVIFEGQRWGVDVAPTDGTWKGDTAYDWRERGWKERRPDRLALYFTATDDDQVFRVRGHGHLDTFGTYKLTGKASREGAVWKLELVRTYTADVPALPPRATLTEEQRVAAEEGRRIRGLFVSGSGVPPDIKRCIANAPEQLLETARLHVKPSTIPVELLRAGAVLVRCGTSNRCGSGGFHVGSTESEADALQGCALQIAANAASCLVRREGSLEFDALPVDVQDAAKLAYDGHPADHEEDELVMGRLWRFLLPPRRGVLSVMRAGLVVHYALVAPGQYEEYPTAALAARAAHEKNRNIREENERLDRVAKRLAALAEKHGRQNEVPPTLLAGVSTSVPDPASRRLVEADRRGGRGLYKKPLAYLDQTNEWASEDVRRAGLRQFYMPAPGADTRFDWCFVGDRARSTPSIRAVADRVWSETLQATRPGRERVDDFNERAFEANLHILVLVECGFDRSDLEKPKVRAALQRRLAFGTVHSDYVASRRSLVLTTKSVLVYGADESHVWTAYARFCFGIATIWERAAFMEKAWRDARQQLVRTETVPTFENYVRESAGAVDADAAMGQGEAEATGPDLAVDMGLDALMEGLDLDAAERAFHRYKARRANNNG